MWVGLEKRYDHKRKSFKYKPNKKQTSVQFRSDCNVALLTGPGGHVSKFSLSWLAENSYEGRKTVMEQPCVLWNANIYQNACISAAKWDKFMSCDSELKKFLQNYLWYGIAFVDDVPATVEATEEVIRRVSLIR